MFPNKKLGFGPLIPCLHSMDLILLGFNQIKLKIHIPKTHNIVCKKIIIAISNPHSSPLPPKTYNEANLSLFSRCTHEIIKLEIDNDNGKRQELCNLICLNN